MTRVIRNRVEGIAEPLPSGESVLWSGRPAAIPFARRILKVDWVAAWFLLLGVWNAVDAYQAGAGIEAALLRGLGQLPLALAALGLLLALGYAMARSTTYALTQQRLVFQVGVALPITVNLPLRFIDGAAIETASGECADLVLTLSPESQARRSALWPHVRTAARGQVQPVMREVSAASLALLAPLLQEALQRSQAGASGPVDAALMRTASGSAAAVASRHSGRLPSGIPA